MEKYISDSRTKLCDDCIHSDICFGIWLENDKCDIKRKKSMFAEMLGKLF